MTLTIFLLTFAVISLLAILWTGFTRLQDLNKRLGSTHDIGGGDEALVTLDELSRQKALIQQEIKEIELDFEMGKIDADDAKRLKRRFERLWLDVDDQLQTLIGHTKEQRSIIDVEIQRRLQSAQQSNSPLASSPKRSLCPHCAALYSGTTCDTCGESFVSSPSSPPSHLHAPST